MQQISSRYLLMTVSIKNVELLVPKIEIYGFREYIVPWLFRGIFDLLKFKTERWGAAAQALVGQSVNSWSETILILAVECLTLKL